MENDEPNYKQIAFKLQSDIDFLRWQEHDKDLAFLKEIKNNLVEFNLKKDITRYEMAIKMIDDWIDELKSLTAFKH